MTASPTLRRSAAPSPDAGPAADAPLVGPVLTRVAGLDAAVLDAVVPPVGPALERLTDLARALTGTAEPLGEALHGLVPSLDDDVALRRRVLAVRRGLRKGRPAAMPEPERTRFSARADARAAALLDRWDDLVGERDATRASIAAELRRHRSATVERLGEVLATHGVLPSLAIAAPDWVRYGVPGVLDGRASPRDLRTWYSYLIRAAVKTSPFSGLTTVGRAGAKGGGRARSRTALLVARTALARLARDPATARVLRYRVAPLRPGGPTEPAGVLLHSELVVAGGVVWRDDRVVPADHARHWVDLLGADGRPLGCTEVLDLVGGPDPFGRFVRLLDSGILHPIVPWTLGEDPLEVLATLVGDRCPRGSAGALRAVRQAGADVATGGTDDRITAAGLIGRTAAIWSTDPDGGSGASLLYEDRETDLDLLDPRSVPHVADDLRELGRRVRPSVFRSHLYDLIVDAFVSEFGAGGTCRDPLGFVMRLAVDGDSHPALDAAVLADLRCRSDPGSRAWLPVGSTSAPPATGALVQLEADGPDDVRAGRYRMVVNQFTAGSGGLLARFRSLLGPEFDQELRAHVSACWPSIPCRELTLWTDCNTAQAECAGLLPSLVLPGDVEGPGALTLDRTVLRHDAGTGTLDLCDPDGAPFGLVYLGLIPQYQLQSYARLLAVLADPWVNASPLSDHAAAQHAEVLARGRDDVLALPRRQLGRVVTRRASWIMPTDRWPRPERPRGDDVDLLLRAEDVRERYGLPDEVFVQQLGARPPVGDHKPMWAGLRSPLSLDVLDRWLADEPAHLRLTEVLPGRGAAWQPGGAGSRRVTEHAVLLAWPDRSWGAS